MFRNYLKIAFRNLSNNRLFTGLNIVGLSVGLAAGLLMLMWAQDELSGDSHHRDVERIFRENANMTSGERQLHWPTTPAPHALYALREVPEVEAAVRAAGDDKLVLRAGERSGLEKDGAFVDSSFFQVFTVNFLRGNPARPFAEASSIILSETLAKKYFHSTDAVGKIIEVGGQKCAVSAVVADLPDNSELKADYFRNLELLNKSFQPNDYWKSMEDDWGDFNFVTFLKLRPGASPEAVGRKLADIHHAHNPFDKTSQYILQPLRSLHLTEPDGSSPGLQTVRTIGLAGLLLILIACINYMNLSTAHASGRAREVGLRKVVGADKWQLLTQFLVETGAVFVLACSLAVACAALMLPWVNQIADKKMRLDLLDPRTAGLFGGAMLATLLLSGLYPAAVLSAFRPLDTLKGNFLSGLGAAGIRRGLVVTQFVFSTGLVVAMLVIGGQLDFIRHKNLGYDRENVLAFSLTDAMMAHRDAFRQELAAQPGISAVTTASNSLLNLASTTGDTDWEGKSPDQQMMVADVGRGRASCLF